jgi:hypothetical protein
MCALQASRHVGWQVYVLTRTEGYSFCVVSCIGCLLLAALQVCSECKHALPAASMP